MPYAAVVSSNRWLIAAALIALFTLGFAPIASAQQVNAWICTAPAAITLDQPASDSVQANGQTLLSGTVRQANQIEVSIDGQLDSIIPLAFAATTYSATIQLSAGTHTIDVEAVDSCQIGNATASAVLTYQPQVEPSAGGNVPTISGSDAPTMSGGVVIGEPQQQGVEHSMLADWFRPLTVPLLSLARYLNLYDTFNTNPQSTPQIVRFVLFVVGLLLLLFSRIVSMYAPVKKRLQRGTKALGLRSIHAGRIIIICIGALLIWLAFLL